MNLIHHVWRIIWHWQYLMKFKSSPWTLTAKLVLATLHIVHSLIQGKSWITLEGKRNKSISKSKQNIFWKQSSSACWQVTINICPSFSPLLISPLFPPFLPSHSSSSSSHPFDPYSGHILPRELGLRQFHKSLTIVEICSTLIQKTHNGSCINPI